MSTRFAAVVALITFFSPTVLAKPDHPVEFDGHTAEVMSVAWSPDGKTLSSSDGRTLVWDRATRKELFRIDPGFGSTYSAWHPTDSTVLATGGILWDEPPGKPFTVLDHCGSLSVWRPDGKVIASVRLATDIVLMHVGSGKKLNEWIAKARPRVQSLAWRPDGKVLASASYEDGIRFWAATGQELGQLKAGPLDRIVSVAWSPDGKTLAAASYDTTVRLWDPTALKLVAEFKDHTEPVFSVAWSPDGKRLASGGRDRSIRVWDPTTGKPTARLTGHDDKVHAVSWSPDGRELASASADKTVRIWSMVPSK